LSFSSAAHPRALPSFPTRRSSDLLMRSGSTAIAYETVTDARGGLPLLAPMSEVAGRMAVHVGAHYLEKGQGGQGILLAGVPGVRSEEHTSELQSRSDLVCRLLLEK